MGEEPHPSAGEGLAVPPRLVQGTMAGAGGTSPLVWLYISRCGGIKVILSHAQRWSHVQ